MLRRLAILALFLQLPAVGPPPQPRPVVPAPRGVSPQPAVIRLILPPGWRVRRPTGITDGVEIIELVGPGEAP